MILLPANAELADNAGTGPEGHRRSSSVDSGASSDATMVASDIDCIDGADMGAIDGCHKLVATGKLRTSPPEPSHERAASDPEMAAHDAKRGRVSTDTASGAPALATTTTTAAGSSTAAAPITVSANTATALAVADPNADALNVPNEASDAGQHEAAPADSAPAPAVHDSSAASAAGSAGPDGVIAAGTPAPASSVIVGRSIAHHGGPAHARASATAGAAGALGSAASASATIDANPTSRGDAGCPETPVILRRSHAVAIRPFSIGRTATLAPAPQAGGSKSAVLVANATSRVHAHCPSTPVVSRMPVPQSHAIPGTAALPAVHVNGGQYSAFAIGRRSSAPSTAATAASSTPATTGAVPPTPAAAPAVPPMPATAMSRRLQPQSSPARFSALHTVSRVILRGMRAIRNAFVALFKSDVESTNGRRSTSPGRPDKDVCGDGDAPIEGALHGLRKRQRRRFL